MNREKKLLKNTLILSIGTIIPKLTSFVILPILTGYLTKTEYGTYDLITILASLLLPAVTLQLQTAAFRFLIEQKDNENNKKRIISNILIFIIPVSIITLLILFFVLYKYTIISRILISIYFLFDILYSTCGQIARGLLKSKVYALGSIISSITNLILTIILIYYLKMGLTGVLICMCLSMAVPTIIMISKIKLFKYISVKEYDRGLLKQLLKYSWPMVPNSMSMWIMNASDRLVITLFLGIETNAIYAVAKKIPNIITIAQSTFTMAWQESASLASEDEDSAIYYSKMFDVIFSVMSGIIIFILAGMPVLFKVLIRGNYEEAYNQMPILVLGMFFYSIASYLGGIYVGKKMTKSVGMTTLVAAVINLITCFLLIKIIGLYAASISTLISYIVLTIYRMIDIKRNVKINYNLKKIMLITFILLLFSGISYIKNTICYIFEILFAIAFMLIVNKQTLIQLLENIKNRKTKNQYDKYTKE